MISLDIISGFLGVGKTTFIHRYLQALGNTDEKVILIENDFGNVGIDKDLFPESDLTIYEINKGCLCCSLKGTFINTLIEIAKEVKPDRVILEPSGIFILSEIFELFRYAQISDNYEINSVVTVIDGLHFQEHKVKYGNFLIDQLQNAATVVISKSQEIREEQLLDTVQAVSDSCKGKEVIAGDWNDLTDNEVLAIFKGDQRLQGKILVGNALKDKKRERSHMRFSSYSFSDAGYCSAPLLKDKLRALHSKGYGDIIRAKGFVKKDTGNDFWEFHYVDGEIEIKENPNKDLETALCFIGRDLDTNSLEQLFQ